MGKKIGIQVFLHLYTCSFFKLVEKRAAIRNESNKWANNTVPYYFFEHSKSSKNRY